MSKIKTIILKEWAEIFKNRMVLFTVIFLPLILTAIPLGILFSLRGSEVANATSEIPEQFNAFCPENLDSGDCMQVYLVSQFMLMFMLMPLSIPVAISAYSIVGEKTTRSLEPLLATPITTIELLIGKSISAAIPAIVATFTAFGIFALGAYLLVADKALFLALLDARWLLAVFLAGPLMAEMAINVSLIVSSRVNDPRVAEQLSMVVILPLLAVLFGQMAGFVVIDRQFVLWMSLALLIVDAGLVILAERLFQRETILTRWK